MSGTPSVGLRYRFGAGWKFVRIEPKDAAAQKIEGGPGAFGIWVHGDGQGGTPCIRLRDATGQTHQGARRAGVVEGLALRHVPAAARGGLPPESPGRVGGLLRFGADDDPAAGSQRGAARVVGPLGRGE